MRRLSASNRKKGASSRKEAEFNLGSFYPPLKAPSVMGALTVNPCKSKAASD